MSNLTNWALKQVDDYIYHPSKWTRVTTFDKTIPTFWNGGTSNKILGLKIPSNYGYGMDLDPHKTTILGGMCLIATSEMKKIYNGSLRFATIEDFHNWYKSWYPRIDQIHDAVGIPPKCSSSVVYVSEDSIFSRKLAKYTGLNKDLILDVLHNVHKEQGHPVLCNYLECNGFKGDVRLVFTSEIEKELSTALRIWERLLNFNFPNPDVDAAKIELMYTGLWLDILEIKGPAIIYEPANKMYIKSWLKLNDWFTTHDFGSNINRNLGIIGYLPFTTSKGDLNILDIEDVPNFYNYKEHKISENDKMWYATNLLFSKKNVYNGNPEEIPPEKIEQLIKYDLNQYFTI